MIGGRAATLVLVLAALVPAGAHQVPPEAIVGVLNAPAGRAIGVEAAARDAKVPRLLVIRVGEAWYRMSVEHRRTQAAVWLDAWRASVPQGVVSVLDAETDQPVVNFGAGGRVAGVSGPPRSRNRAP